MLILLKWSIVFAKAVSEDAIHDKELLSLLTGIHITKLCYIMCKLGVGAAGHKVSMIAKDNLKLAV